MNNLITVGISEEVFGNFHPYFLHGTIIVYVF